MNPALSQLLNRPLRIGPSRIATRLALAPMTQLGNVAFRRLLAEFGGFGLLFSEMCSARRVPSENRDVSRCFCWRDEERSHLVWQIFGNEPATMAAAAQRIEDEGFFGVDINFGCSVKRICAQNCGADLLKHPDHAARIVSAVRAATALPLFVKFRTGWRDDPAFAVDMARRFEAAGADALTFHPRVSPDRRSRPPKWEYIGRIKEAVSIPVFGNGNVFDANDCLRMLQTTGCDGVAVARLAVAQPWCFAQWADGLAATPALHRNVALRYLALLEQYFDPVTARRRFVRFTAYFAGNFKFGHHLYSRIRAAAHLAEQQDIIEAFFTTPPALAVKPNLSLVH